MSVGAPPSNHPVTIKVLRLANPSLCYQDAANGPMLPQAELLLPKAIGRVYVGEEFKSLLSITNISSHDVNCTLHVEFHTPGDGVETPKLSAGKEESEGDLVVPLGTSLTRVIGYEPKIQGRHSLVVTVKYTLDEQVHVFRKTFRFDISPALRVRTKVLSTPVSRAIEAQIENISDSTIVIDTCTMTTDDTWHIDSLSDEAAMLRHGEIGQWCFLVRDRPSSSGWALSTGWRREPLGARGWLTTTGIQVRRETPCSPGTTGRGG